MILRYGEDFTKVNELSKDEIIKVNHIIALVKERNEKEKRLFFEYFEEFSKDDVLKVILNLSSEEQELLYEKYGKNLNELHIFHDNPKQTALNNLLIKIKRAIHRNNTDVKRSRSLSMCFPACNIEELNIAISKLSDEQKILIYKRYGNNLSELNEVTKAEKTKLQYIFNKLKKLLLSYQIINNNGEKSAYEILGLSKESIAIKLRNFTDEEKELFYKRFGYDLEHPNFVPLSGEEIKIVDGRLIPSLYVSIAKNVSQDDIERVSEIILSIIAKYPNVTQRDAIIFTYRIITLEDTAYNIDALINQFNISLDTINVITKKVMGILGDNFNKVYKDIMVETMSNIARGEKISLSFYNKWCIPDVAYYMIVTGESTGELSLIFYINKYAIIFIGG